MDDQIPVVNNSLPESDSTIICNNCSKSIPKHNFYMHENFCLRNNIKCSFSNCNQILLKSKIDSHLHCPDCGELFSSNNHLDLHSHSFHSNFLCFLCKNYSSDLLHIRKHQNDENCPMKLIKCRFCEDFVFSGGDPDDIRDKFHWNLCKHESECGSKTISCEICKTSVRLKEYDLHYKLHTGEIQPNIFEQNEQLDSKPSNESQSFVAPANSDDIQSDEYLCPICNISLSSLRLLNSHLDTKH